jgi:hypothetical protein
MFCIAVGEGVWLKCAGGGRKILNVRVLRAFRAPGCSRTLYIWGVLLVRRGCGRI